MCTPQTKSHTLDLEGDRVTSGWPPEPSAKTAVELQSLPPGQPLPALQQDRSSRTEGNAPNHAPFNGQVCKPQLLPTASPGPQVGSPSAHAPHLQGPPVVKETAIAPSAALVGVGVGVWVCACARMCVCVLARVHTRTHSHMHVHTLQFLRKSKIAISLNSFPLAARTAFVLQTKRKRNETEGSEEAGRRRERRSRRPRSKPRKRETGRESGRGEGEQGSGRGEILPLP